MFSDRRKGWRGPAGSWLALLGGALLPLSFAPFYWYPLAVVSLILLFASWGDVKPNQAFVRGWLYGLGMFGVGVSWVYVAIHEFGQVAISRRHSVFGVAACTAGLFAEIFAKQPTQGRGLYFVITSRLGCF